MLHSSSWMALLGKGHRQGRKSSLIPVWAPVQTTLSTAQALKYWLFLIFSFPIRTSLCTALAQWWSLLLRASIKFKKLFPKLLSKKSHPFSQAALWSWWFFCSPMQPQAGKHSCVFDQAQTLLTWWIWDVLLSNVPSYCRFGQIS